MTKGKKVLIALASIVAAPFVCVGAYNLVIKPMQREFMYNQAIAFVESDPVEVRKMLEHDIPDYLYPSSHDEGYRCQYELIAYAYALNLYREESYVNAKEYLFRIEENYDGPLNENIAQLKEEITPKAAAQSEKLAEQQRLDKEKAKKEEEERQIRENEVRAEIAEHNVPYVGLANRYIDATQLGAPDTSDDIEEFYDGALANGTKYCWKKGKKTQFIAIVLNGEVVRVHDFVSPRPPFTPDDDKDEYDASEFGNEEDFYDYYYDDFHDYEDAAVYWNEHN